jgi:hypothetical protein
LDKTNKKFEESLNKLEKVCEDSYKKFREFKPSLNIEDLYQDLYDLPMIKISSRLLGQTIKISIIDFIDAYNIQMKSDNAFSDLLNTLIDEKLQELPIQPNINEMRKFCAQDINNLTSDFQNKLSIMKTKFKQQIQELIPSFLDTLSEYELTANKTIRGLVDLINSIFGLDITIEFTEMDVSKDELVAELVSICDFVSYQDPERLEQIAQEYAGLTAEDIQQFPTYQALCQYVKNKIMYQ